MPTEIAVTEARTRFSELMEASAHEPVFLTLEDLAESEAVMAEIMAGTPTIPWSKAKADVALR